MARAIAACLAVVLLATSLWHLAGQTRGLATERLTLEDGTPVTVLTGIGAPPAPAVVIAHGFAGSQGLMLPFATTLARAGYVAVLYDALGHGRHPEPLTGDPGAVEGATARLLGQIGDVIAYARARPDVAGGLALLGHSLASDIVVRAALADPAVQATIAVSLYSPVVTATAPRNLLAITGALEAGLTTEALRVAGLAAGAPAEPFTTSGDFAAGTARRAVLSPGVEHLSVLYSATSLREAAAWLDASFQRSPAPPPAPDRRGGWIGLWLLGAMMLAFAAAPLLPRLAPPAQRLAPRWRGFLAVLILPALATPVLAVLVPGGLLPVPVADYLTVHFALYGTLTALLLRRLGWPGPGRIGWRTLGAAAAAAAFAIAAIYLPIDRFVTAFVPTPERLLLLALLGLGLMTYFLADAALVSGAGAPRGAQALSRLAMLASLGIAIALDPGRLFFLVLILPVMLLFFLLFGLLGHWCSRAAGTPAPAALASAFLFAWAIAVTFPILGT